MEKLLGLRRRIGMGRKTKADFSQRISLGFSIEIAFSPSFSFLFSFIRSPSFPFFLIHFFLVNFCLFTCLFVIMPCCIGKKRFDFLVIILRKPPLSLRITIITYHTWICVVKLKVFVYLIGNSYNIYMHICVIPF